MSRTQRDSNRILILAIISLVMIIVLSTILSSTKWVHEPYRIPLVIVVILVIVLLLVLFICYTLMASLAEKLNAHIKSALNEIELITQKTIPDIQIQLRTLSSHTDQQENLSADLKTISDIQIQLRKLSSQMEQRLFPLKDVNWSRHLENAQQVDFVVQGWDGWMEDNEEYVRKFLGNGGRFHLYIYDPHDEKTTHPLADMAARLSKSPKDVQNEILGTVSRLEQLGKELPEQLRDKKPVKIYYMKTVNWYFAVRISGREFSGGVTARDLVVFSIYSHKRATVRQMPAFVIYPDQDEVFNRWFESELSHLRNSSQSQSESNL